MRIGQHSEIITLFVTHLGHYPLILGLPWLQQHNPDVDWPSKTLTFKASRSNHCREHCLTGSSIVRTQGLEFALNTTAPDEESNLALNAITPNEELNLTLDTTTLDEAPNLTGTQHTHSNDQTLSASHPRRVSTSSRRRHSDWKSDLPRYHRESPDEHYRNDHNHPEQLPQNRDTSHLPPLNICQIGPAPFRRLTRFKDAVIFAVTIRDIEKALEPKPEIDPRTKLPQCYHDYLDVFSKKAADKLPEHRPYDHKIILESGKSPTAGPLYNMSQDELLVLRKYLDDNLTKGFIRASSSPAASPVLFVRKPGGGLRFCVDYRGLNTITIKDRYPIPLVQETLHRLSKAVIYTKLDIIAAFNRLRIAEGHEWMTAFKTRYGLYEYLVMPFGLANAPSSFQRYINDALHEYLDVFCTAYIDDILIYSDSITEHQKHVRLVLERLREYGLQIDISKCEFHVTEVSYLGLIVTTNGIRMDPKKVATIQEWEPPRCVKDLQGFLGFANFYRRFIRSFSRIAKPLTALTKKGTIWNWSRECNNAFTSLKKAFTSAPILRHFDATKEVIVETDASDFVSGGILSQYDDEGTLHPVAFFSKKHSPEECNYEIYDKELLAIIRAFEQWRPELEGSPFPVKVLCDHKNLQYFMTTKLLSRRQARWSEFLSRFNFVITYIPGKANGKADALTRRSGDLPQKGDVRLEQQNQVVIKSHNLHPKLQLHASKQTDLDETSSSIETDDSDNDDPTLDNRIEEAYQNQGDLVHQILKALREDSRQDKIFRDTRISPADCTEINGKLHYRDKLFLPDSDKLRLHIFRLAHDSVAAGHPGVAKTYELVSRHYYYPGLHHLTKRYVLNCMTCARTKASRERYSGLLRPLPVPDQRWKEVSIDFVVGLPNCQGHDAIMVVVDRLSKMRHLTPCSEKTSSADTAKLYYHNIWKLHGLPRAITSDRGPQFISEFWKRLTKRLGIILRLSTAYHPQTDGQTENANAVMEQYLRAYINHHQDDWVDWLPGAEFAANNHSSETTKMTPFMANYGFNPVTGLEPRQESGRQTPRRLQTKDADTFVEKLTAIEKECHAQMTYAQAAQEESANKTRTPAPSYRVGDMVLVSSKNLRSDRPSSKLDLKAFGPYPITKVISPYAYRIELPVGSTAHNVFHVSKLRLVRNDPLPGQRHEPPPPLMVGDTADKDLWEVDEILDSRIRRRRPQYLIKYTGYPASWQPASDIDSDSYFVKDFHQRYPRKSGPWPTN